MNQSFSTLVGAAVCALLVSINSHAAPGEAGTIDATWGGTGQVKTPIGLNGSGDPSVVAAVLQADRRLVVAAYCSGAEANLTLPNPCLIRYLPDGTLDASFGSGGIVHQSWTANVADRPVAVLVQSDQKLIVVGACGNVCFARLNVDGSFDTSYGPNGTGIVYYNSAPTMVARHAEMHPDGRFSIVGWCTDGRLCARRFNTSGVSEGFFGTFDLAAHDITAGDDISTHSVAEIDGAVTIAGQCNGQACVVRLNSSGALDTSFNGTGFRLSVCPSTDFASRIRRQPDGKYLVGGSVLNAGLTTAVCVTRLNADGSLDTGFATAGVYSTNFAGAAFMTLGDIHLQPDGRIIVSASCSAASNTVCARRLNSDGTQDPSFANVNGGTLAFSGGAGQHGNPVLIVPTPNGNFNLVNRCNTSAIAFGQVCSFRFEGGPQAYRQCNLDLDGDGRVLSITDALMLARMAIGFKGLPVTNGITFAAHATRTTPSAIQSYLVEQCGFSQ